MTSPALLLEELIGGRISAEALTWLQRGFEEYDRCDGAKRLDRCLELPTAKQRRLERRNFWLQTAAAAMPVAPTAEQRAEALRKQLEAFVTRGPWRKTRELAQPPREFTALQVALWNAARADVDGALCSRQIARILADMDCPSNVGSSPAQSSAN